MKKAFFLFLFLTYVLSSTAQEKKDSIIEYMLPDSVKAIQLMSDVTINTISGKGSFRIKLKTGGPSISMYPGSFVFHITELDGRNPGINTRFDLKEYGCVFSYDWKPNETYKFLISQATDSAAAITQYGGYVFLPRENKWKFLGSYPVRSWNPSLKNPSIIYRHSKKQIVSYTIGQTWIQRNNGSWKLLKGDPSPNPLINWFGHLDSIAQRKIDDAIIQKNTVAEKGSLKDGVYYEIIQQGTGAQINVTDTVSVFYRVNLLNDTTTIDQAKDTPARFPLNRLIRGWQIGVPLLRVGGKIRLIIPSDLAYTIRTRGAKIPPNSILEFTIEAVDSTPGL